MTTTPTTNHRSPRTFGAATPATLHAIGATRAALTTLHHATTPNPFAPHASGQDRHLALSSVLGNIAHTLLHPDDPTLPPDAGLAELDSDLITLAAITLAWLDALPPPPNDPGDDTDEANQAHPF